MSAPIFTTSTEADRTGRRYFALIVPIALAAICLWTAMPKAAVSRGVGFQPANVQPENLSSLAQTPSVRNATPVSLPATSPKRITRPIETIRPGMRVLADNPEGAETQPDADVTPEHWRLVSLQMSRENGSTLHVQLLRPIEWLVTEAVVLIVEAKDPQELFATPAPTNPDRGTVDLSLQRLLLGQSIYLDLPELGAQGPATVTTIDPCPSLDPAQTGRRLVTGTFRHSAANVIDVQIGRESESFGVTDNHPFWSIDRKQFVEAGQLEIGEHLQCADTTITQVTRITPRRGPPVEVYNFEVDAEHVYHVGSSGVLVHNTCHSYAIINRVTGQVFKFGVSRRGFTVGGLSQRAQAQLTTIATRHGLSRADLQSVVLRHFNSTSDMFQWEDEVVGIWRSLNHGLPDNIRPIGNSPFLP